MVGFTIFCFSKLEPTRKSRAFPWEGTLGAGFEVGTPSGTHLGRGGSLYLIIHVLADFLQGALDALQIIVSHSPAAAVLRIILTVHKDCPSIFYLAFIVLEAVVVNAEAAALGGIVVHGILRFADAADGVFLTYI